MTPRDLIAAFDVLAEAPDGVKRLRELVLELAVRGRLVPRSAPEGDAADVLHRIARERRRVEQMFRARRPIDTRPVTKEEEPFEIPEHWTWVRLQDVGVVVGGGTPRSSDSSNFTEEGGHPWLTPADMRQFVDGKYIRRGARNLTDEGLQNSSAQLMPAGTVVFSSRAPIGYVAIAANPLSTNQGFKSVVPYLGEMSEFLRVFLLHAAPAIDAVAPGTTFKEVSGSFMAAYPFPVPPLAEQRRIVARVDELMALLDRLEAARATREQTRRAARDAALAELRDAPDAEAVEAAWGRIARQMDDLFAEPEDVGPLRQTVLQLAAQGLLTEGDSGNWEEAVLGKVLVEGPTNGWSPKAVEYPTLVKTLKLSATTKGWFDASQFKYVDPEGGLDERLWLEPGDLLIQRSNTPEYVGTAAVYDGPARTFIYPDLIMRCRVSDRCDVRFVHIALSAPNTRAWLAARASGTSKSMVKINQATVVSVPLRLPDRETQARIVAKVDELMAFCDDLESRLAATRDVQARFAAAAVHHLNA